MPRDDIDDDEDGGGPAGALAKTSRAISTLGHGASGGHGPAGKSSAMTKSNRTQWSPNDPSDRDDYRGVAGGKMGYQFQEYPKHVYPDSPSGLHEHSPSRKGVMVRNEAEEATALAGLPITREADERARMMKIVEMHGLTVDGRWKLAKIAQAITDAGHDPAFDPTK